MANALRLGWCDIGHSLPSHQSVSQFESNRVVLLCADCIAGPCSGMGGSDSWQIMVQMLRVAGAERLLPKPTSPPRPPIFQRTLNFVIALAHNMDYGFHPSYSMDYANASNAGESATVQILAPPPPQLGSTKLVRPCNLPAPRDNSCNASWCGGCGVSVRCYGRCDVKGGFGGPHSGYELDAIGGERFYLKAHLSSTPLYFFCD